jgi:hypothetical protein
VPPAPPLIALAHVTRQRFCARVGLVLPEVGQGVRDHLNALADNAVAMRDMQTARDALAQFDRLSRSWTDGVRSALQTTLQQQQTAKPGPTTDPGGLELVSTEAVEDQLLASKLALTLHDVAAQAWTDLRVRLLFAENRTELAPTDVVHPETLARVIFDEWVRVGLSRDNWKMLASVVQPSCGQKLAAAYQEANQFLISNGVMPEINLKHSVRKAPSKAAESGTNTTAGGLHDNSRHAPAMAGKRGTNGFAPTAHMGEAARTGGSHAEVWGRARQQAQDLMGRLKRLLVEHTPAPATGYSQGASLAGAVAPSGAPTGEYTPSPGLQALLDTQRRVPPPPMAPGGGQGGPHAGDVARQVAQATEMVRQRSTELKDATHNLSEKATIEVVALMFQSILTEDRIQATLRIWFARLQIPVLRVALAEPDFFSSLQHPARRLIDRMGSCALGFDANLSEVSAKALEVEIRRIVQVIEQYPETGRRVFQLVFDEFQKFLTTQLHAQGTAGKLVTVAQQMEQKEALAVQYTIELRKLLNDMPVRDEVRDFMFKVWAEVLAIATVKFGAKHADMLALKQTAGELLWAASAKPTRVERAQAISQLPGLLTRLRKGMALLGLNAAAQDAHIKTLSDTMADAFMSKTESIPAAQLAAVTRNLSALEDFLPEDGVGDLELDQESIEMITGVDASNIEVITSGGAVAGEMGRGWAQELQLGTWFQLDHNSHIHQVQLAWRSLHGQLCLFTTTHQRCFLIQTTRVAAYLQAGLLLPAESETLTVRATRAALEKLEANPERLVH